jgi:hypothetical protein
MSSSRVKPLLVDFRFTSPMRIFRKVLKLAFRILHKIAKTIANGQKKDVGANPRPSSADFRRYEKVRRWKDRD